jgi:hypothetical protein
MIKIPLPNGSSNAVSEQIVCHMMYIQNVFAVDGNQLE